MATFLLFLVISCTFHLFYNELMLVVIRRDTNAKVKSSYVKGGPFAPCLSLSPSFFLPLGFGTMLSSVALLSILVFLPSAVVVVLLLVRMARKSAGLKKRSKSGYKKSSIEVSDE